VTFLPRRGYIELRRRYRGDYSHDGETKWFFTAGREFGLWYLTAHGFGLYFSIIGPFRFREVQP
jgi:hypothetical protein